MNLVKNEIQKAIEVAQAVNQVKPRM